jgi:hypothetical protein
MKQIRRSPRRLWERYTWTCLDKQLGRAARAENRERTVLAPPDATFFSLLSFC